MTDQIDVHTHTWRAVTAWAKDEISVSQNRLEVPGLSRDLTEFHRGRIAALRQLLALPERKEINPAHVGGTYVD